MFQNYSLNIYRYSPVSNKFWSYLYGNDITLCIDKDGYVEFIPPIQLRENMIIMVSIFRRIHLAEILSDHEQYNIADDRLLTLSTTITKNHILPYSKVIAIHDWVAVNIYYDEDAYRSGNYKHNDASALATLDSRKGVCQGYTNLSIALLRAIGIPAMQIECSTQTSRLVRNGDMENHHVFTAVYVDAKWIFMDVTWDSDNYCLNGERKYRTGLGVSHKYFDMDINLLSSTHILF